MSIEWDIFLSHASEDKTIACQLVDTLRGLGISVWFDEAEIKIGHSLRRKIDEGLRKSRFGVVLLSPAFFSKEWAQKELDALFGTESVPGSKILPVRLNLSPEALGRYSAILADRYSPAIDQGIDSVAKAIATRLAEIGCPAVHSDSAHKPFKSDVPWAKPRVSNPLALRLARKLIADFSDTGIHAGEFGQTASLVEQGTWAKGGPDRVAVKPWYYLTYWAVRGLEIVDKESLDGITQVIVSGIERRIGNRWIEVALRRDATYDTVPGEPDIILAKSYRHTIRGANILLLLQNSHRLVDQVASDLAELELQRPGGGWPQCDRVFVDQDLWASAYFLRFSSEFEQIRRAKQQEYSPILSTLRRRGDLTVDFLVREWRTHQWAYRGMPPVASVPKLLIDLAPTIRNAGHEFTESLTTFLLDLTTSAGRLVRPEDLSDLGISEVKQLIRIALGLSLLANGADINLAKRISPILQSAINLLSIDSDLGPEDISFAIHLIAQSQDAIGNTSIA